MREMKDSGVEWIGEIPKDWRIVQVKHLFRIGRGRVIGQDELVDNGKYPVYSSQTKNDGCLGYLNTFDYDANQLTWTTDGANAGTVFLRRGKHNCTNVCGTLVASNNDISLDFEKYALEHIVFYHKRLDTNGYKIMNNEMAVIKTVFPSLDEQKHIASYLDSKCSKIDAIIEKQQTVIEKLKEYKLSLITEAVTKGLNPDVPMKDSGVEWIGVVPDSASITRAGHVYSIILGKMLSTKAENNDDTLEKYFCAADVHFDGINYNNLKRMWFTALDRKNYKVQNSDLLVVEGGAGAGGAYIVDRDIKNCFVQNSIMIVRPKCHFSNKWLYYTLYALVHRNYIDFICNKATIPHFTKEKLGNMPVVLMPKSIENKIVDFLDRKCSVIDATISKKQALIEKLKAYKKSLIYEVVTGKKEV